VEMDIKDLKLSLNFRHFFTNAYNITNFMFVRKMHATILFSRTTLLPVILQNCFAVVEEVSKNDEQQGDQKQICCGNYGNMEYRECIRASSRNQKQDVPYCSHVLARRHQMAGTKIRRPQKEDTTGRRKMIR